MNHFCTISTVSHLYKTYALADSLLKTGEACLHVLITDGNPEADHKICKFYNAEHIRNFSVADTILRKYHRQKDKLRWSLKPVFMNFLLSENTTEKLIYLDNDIFLYASCDFLFDLLNEHSFLLTPHYYKVSPKKEQNWFEANFRVGLYNAGFAGANKNATETLHWWADCCAYRCEKSSFRGLFDDQKYLDLVPIINPSTHIVRHQGCNVAGWNTDVCKRELINNRVLINGKYPIVFIHFNDTTIREILSGSDKILWGYYRDYIDSLRKHKANLKESDLLTQRPLVDSLKYIVWKIITELGI